MTKKEPFPVSLHMVCARIDGISAQIRAAEKLLIMVDPPLGPMCPDKVQEGLVEWKAAIGPCETCSSFLVCERMGMTLKLNPIEVV